jgi:hypothetical protein
MPSEEALLAAMNSPSAEECDAVLLLGLSRHAPPVDHEDVAPDAATRVGIGGPIGVDEPLK